MSDDAPIPAPAPAAGPDGLEERIRALANEIVDPCSAAQALPVGLVDMGLLLRVQLEPAGGEAEAGRWAVRLLLRATAPGCFYIVFFERELRARIEPLPEVVSLELEWDGAWDWTPDEIAPAVREQLAERRRLVVLAGAPKATG